MIDGHPADATALVSRGRTTTYGELRDQAGRLRGGLVRVGLERGDRFAIVCGNNWYFVVSYLAALGAGLVAVPLNPQSPAPELGRQLAEVGARGVMVGPSGSASVAAIDRAAVPSLDVVIAAHGVELDGALDLDELLAGEPEPMVERADEDLAVLLFTSGTAGAPKAAMLSHGNLLSNFRQTEQVKDAERSDDVILGIVPLYHILGLNGVLGLAFHAGAAVVLVERFDPVSALASITRHGATIVAGPPTMWTAWAMLDDADPEAMRSVRLAISGASKLPTATVDRVLERFGIRIHEGYGLTETAPIVATSIGTDAPIGSVGSPVPGVQVRVVDTDGDDTLVGDTGEIWVKGPNVFQGYWKDDEATRAVLGADGWLRTGDLGAVDDDGYLHLIDRVKDLVIVSGFNVFPAEVEDELAAHPAVSAVAVVGIPHPHTGEAVKAYIVPVPGAALEEDELIAWCQERIARYKCPSKIEFVDELPSGTVGKVLRRTLPR